MRRIRIQYIYKIRYVFIPLHQQYILSLAMVDFECSMLCRTASTILPALTTIEDRNVCCEWFMMMNIEGVQSLWWSGSYTILADATQRLVGMS